MSYVQQSGIVFGKPTFISMKLWLRDTDEIIYKHLEAQISELTGRTIYCNFQEPRLSQMLGRVARVPNADEALDEAEAGGDPS